MSREILSTVVLNALRTIGDPELDGRIAYAQGAADSWQLGWTPDFDKLALAQRLFATYPLEISGALILAALPQSYATGFGAGVLAARGVLVDDLGRRVKDTAGFLLGVTRPAKDLAEQRLLWFPDDPMSADPADPAPWLRCALLRSYHAQIRKDLRTARDDDPQGTIASLLEKDDAEPLNQEDLLGMLLTLSITVFEVLESYGLTWSIDDQEAYLHLWDVVGGYLGIGNAKVIEVLEHKIDHPGRLRDPLAATGPMCGPNPSHAGDRGQKLTGSGSGADWSSHIRTTWHGLRPPTIEDTRALLAQIRRRQWPDPSPDWATNHISHTPTRAGRILVRALLDTLGEAMPRSMERLPIALMRALNPDVVSRRLNLGGNGFALRALSLLPRRHHRTGRFTSVSAPNPIAGRILRSMANEVTLRASLRFIDNPNFVFPAIGDWPA